MTLEEFLAARLDEDEAVARDAGGSAPQGSWAQVAPERRPGRIECDSGYIVTYDEGSPDDGQAAHIARHDPARVLREVEAGRKLIELSFRDAAVIDQEWGCCHDAEQIRAGLCERMQPDNFDDLRVLAAVWNDHPDYDEAWQ